MGGGGLDAAVTGMRMIDCMACVRVGAAALVLTSQFLMHRSPAHSLTLLLPPLLLPLLRLVGGRRGLERGKAEEFDAVIVDTAGRLQIDERLMEELREVSIDAPARALLVLLGVWRRRGAACSLDGSTLLFLSILCNFSSLRHLPLAPLAPADQGGGAAHRHAAGGGRDDGAGGSRPGQVFCRRGGHYGGGEELALLLPGLFCYLVWCRMADIRVHWPA